MNSMTPDVARVLLRDRVAEAAERQRRIDARRGARQARQATTVPQQRSGTRLLSLLVPRTGVRVSTR